MSDRGTKKEVIETLTSFPHGSRAKKQEQRRKK